MTYKASFEGIWAKVDWADEHLKALKAIVVAPVSSQGDQVKLRSKYDAKTDHQIMFVVERPTEWMTRIALVLGDAVHNVRGALDHLMWQLALIETDGQEPAWPKKIQFPIKETPTSPKGEGLKYIPGPYAAMIEQRQPENAGYEPLGLLRVLSNHDKHRVLTPVLVRPLGFRPPKFSGGIITDMDRSHSSASLEVGTEFMRYRVAPVDDTYDPKVEVEGYVAPQVSLSESGVSLLWDLNTVRYCVEDILITFEQRLHRDGHLAHPPAFR